MSRRMVYAIVRYAVVIAAVGHLSPKAVAQTPGTWIATGTMGITRYRFTATLLLSGKVLVAGGCTDTSCDNITFTAELYDPTSGIWIPTGFMKEPLAMHTATLLPSGKVLVAGGQASNATSDAELYDPNTGTWSFTGNMTTARVAHTATLITKGPLSGMVLVAGGSSACTGCTPLLDSAELYDPQTGLWTLTGSMALARYWDSPSPATLQDGSILVLGGTTCCPYLWFFEAESYDPVAHTWTQSANNPTANGSAALLSNGRVLVAGGLKGVQPTAVNVAAADLFDSGSGTWVGTASMSTDRAEHTLTVLPSSEALVAGGNSGGWGVCNDLTSAELYDPNAGKWSLTGNMSVARFYHTATLLATGQVLVAGGGDCEGNAHSSAELYTSPPGVVLSPQSVVFSGQVVGTTNNAQAVSLTNFSEAPLTIGGLGATGDFAVASTGTTCSTSSPVPAGSSCQINVTFTPTASGSRTGTLTVADSNPTSPLTAALTGIGEDFGVTVASGSSSAWTVSAGGTATYTISVSPFGGFNQMVTMSCMGAPSLSTCTASASSLTLDGTNSQHVTFTVETTASALVAQRARSFRHLAFSFLMPLFAFAVVGARQRTVIRPGFLVVALLLGSLIYLGACGNGSRAATRNPGTPPGTYTLTITGTAGNLSHSTQVTLKVQ